LGLLYGGIAQRLGLPVLPLNLPDNFALAYLNPEAIDSPIGEDSALFFINPANNGTFFGKSEIDEFLGKIGIVPEPFYYYPMHNIDSIILMLDYLILSFNKLGNKIKASELRLLQNCIRNG
jgi:regulator of sirC expression with transglutaminase-like and TPR domain